MKAPEVFERDAKEEVPLRENAFSQQLRDLQEERAVAEVLYVTCDRFGHETSMTLAGADIKVMES